MVKESRYRKKRPLPRSRFSLAFWPEVIAVLFPVPLKLGHGLSKLYSIPSEAALNQRSIGAYGHNTTTRS